MNKWTKEVIDQVKQLVQYGLSDLEIAKVLNTTCMAIEAVRRRNGIVRKGGVGSAQNIIQNIGSLSEEEVEKLKREWSLKWNVNVSRKQSAQVSPAKFKTILVTADHHVPDQDVPANRSILKLMDKYSFDGLYIVGDFMDMAPISHHLIGKKKYKSLESQRMMQDYTAGNALLDEYDKRLRKGVDN